LQGTSAEVRIAEAEETHRARRGGDVTRAAVNGGTHRQPVAGGVERHGATELVVRLQPGDIDVFAARVSLAQCSLQRAAAEAGIAEGKEMHRARIGGDVTRAGVTVGPYGQSVAGSV
jgi:hypothetical protein